MKNITAVALVPLAGTFCEWPPLALSMLVVVLILVEIFERCFLPWYGLWTSRRESSVEGAASARRSRSSRRPQEPGNRGRASDGSRKAIVRTAGPPKR